MRGAADLEQRQRNRTDQTRHRDATHKRPDASPSLPMSLHRLFGLQRVLEFAGYSMDGPVGFLRFGEGTLAICGPGSSRIVKFQWNLKVLRPE